jgi:nitrous oxidase accessory protein NosD
MLRPGVSTFNDEEVTAVRESGAVPRMSECARLTASRVEEKAMKRLYMLCTVVLTATALGCAEEHGAPAAPSAAGIDAPTAYANGEKTRDVPRDYATIQAAIDAASPGDVIMVAPGTYCEQVVIEKSDLTLRAAPGVGNPAILTGACETGGFGIHSHGISVTGVKGVEISGFIIEGFSTGIFLHATTESRVFGNEIRYNVYLGVSAPFAADAVGILLRMGSNSNEIQQNRIHDNGHLGIGLFNGNSSNLIRANWLTDNQTQYSNYAGFACSLMLWGTTNRDNRIVENEVTNSLSVGGAGIMIGPSAQNANVVAQNRVHGHFGPGIVVNPWSYDNVIEQNNAVGNGFNNGVDLKDWSTIPNLWQRNLGTCAPGNAGCD